jgi:hypothetical protein
VGAGNTPRFLLFLATTLVACAYILVMCSTLVAANWDLVKAAFTGALPWVVAPTAHLAELNLGTPGTSTSSSGGGGNFSSAAMGGAAAAQRAASSERLMAASGLQLQRLPDSSSGASGVAPGGVSPTLWSRRAVPAAAAAMASIRWRDIAMAYFLGMASLIGGAPMWMLVTYLLMTIAATTSLSLGLLLTSQLKYIARGTTYIGALKGQGTQPGTTSSSSSSGAGDAPSSSNGSSNRRDSWGVLLLRLRQLYGGVPWWAWLLPPPLAARVAHSDGQQKKVR